MIIVIETWTLASGLEDRALELMQSMDDLVGPPAHEHPGWCGHARFFQDPEDPSKVLMLYPWRSRQLHEELTENEEELLRDFHEKFCAAPRQIHYYEELMVDVEHDDDHAQ